MSKKKMVLVIIKHTAHANWLLLGDKSIDFNVMLSEKKIQTQDMDSTEAGSRMTVLLNVSNLISLCKVIINSHKSFRKKTRYEFCSRK